jgi:hypothetical protein
MKSRKLTRWAHEIEEFGCDIQHLPGTQNKVADALSRAPVSPLPEEPDHLEGSRDIYTPILALTWYSNLLDKILSAQEKDSEIQRNV